MYYQDLYPLNSKDETMARVAANMGGAGSFATVRSPSTQSPAAEQNMVDDVEQRFGDWQWLFEAFYTPEPEWVRVSYV